MLAKQGQGVSDMPHRTTGGCEESTCNSQSKDKVPPDHQPMVRYKLYVSQLVLLPTYEQQIII